MIPHGVEIFVALEPVDMRLGFDRLAGLAESQLGRASRSGAMFLFFGKRRTALKVLFFDGSGLCVFHNHLSSHYTSFRSDLRTLFFVGRRARRRSVGESIPPTTVLRRTIRGILVEPGVGVVRVRFDDAVPDPGIECGCVDPKACCQLLLRQQSSRAQSIETRA